MHPCLMLLCSVYKVIDSIRKSSCRGDGMTKVDFELQQPQQRGALSTDYLCNVEFFFEASDICFQKVSDQMCCSFLSPTEIREASGAC